jgi:hypothetical protein
VPSVNPRLRFVDPGVGYFSGKKIRICFSTLFSLYIGLTGGQAWVARSPKRFRFFVVRDDLLSETGATPSSAKMMRRCFNSGGRS